MPMPTDVGIIDTMIGFPAKDFEHYEFIRKQLKDAESAEFDFPVEYMFTQGEVRCGRPHSADPGRDGRLRCRVGPYRLRG